MADAQRSDYCLVPLGWFVAFAAYVVQACFLMKFLEEHTTTQSNLYWIGLVFYFALGLAVLITLCATKGYAEDDDEVLYVWVFWFIYIVLFMISVAVIFSEIVNELEKSDRYGPNFLKSILCITPALLVLIMQLTISPTYRKSVLSLSVIAALNLFDGIEMLEIVLMQKEKEDFNLDGDVEKLILSFACISFILTSLGLARNEFDGDEVQERDNGCVICLGLLEILCTNVPFLVLRIIVWVDYGYEASIFIAKNIVSLIVGLVEFCVILKCCTCE